MFLISSNSFQSVYSDELFIRCFAYPEQISSHGSFGALQRDQTEHDCTLNYHISLFILVSCYMSLKRGTQCFK